MSGEEGEIFGNKATDILSPLNFGLKMMILGFSNERGGKNKQHKIQIFIHRY